MTPRILGATGLVGAAALACMGTGQSTLALAVVVLAPVASRARLGGLPWLAGIPMVLVAWALGAFDLPSAASASAVCVVLAGLSGPPALSPVGAALVLALAAPSMRGVEFLAPLALCGVSLPLVWLARTPWKRALTAWGGSVLAMVGITAVGFALVPRVGVAPREMPALTGFQARVDLDDASELLDDPTLIARVEVLRGQVTEPLRLRGVALQSFDGQRWTAPAVRESVPVGLASTGPQVRVVPLGRIDEGALFGLGTITGVSMPASTDAAGNWWGGAAASEAYTVSLGEAPALVDDVAWRAVPPSLDPRIVSLAREWAGDTRDGLTLARMFTQNLRSNSLYTRHPPTGGGDDPLADFFFGSRSGHCEHWATALTVLLRVQGIAARPVNGFVDLEPDGDGWVVRRSHAHAWVELLVGDTWVTVDPTPGPTVLPEPAPAPLVERVSQTWTADVVGFDVVGQRRAARQVVTTVAQRPWRMLILYALIVSLPGLWWMVRIDRSTLGTWNRVRAALDRHGLQPPPALPPVDAAQWVVDQVGPQADGLVALAWRVYRVRYGGEDERVHRVKARQEARQVMREMGQWQR